MTLLVIADDLTGALDTGVKMAEAGMLTKVTTDTGTDLSGFGDANVLVIDAETRHLAPAAAGMTVRQITQRAVRQGIPHIYKKTDSALRGNIGAELSALLEGSGEACLPFLPALPELKRTTVHGVHYIGAEKVADSVFGRDPFEPVRCSRVSELIGEQSRVPVFSVAPSFQIPDGSSGIYVFDSSTQEDLLLAGHMLYERCLLRISAGSAGFGSVLPELLQISGRKAAAPSFQDGLLVLCGSMNPITREQLALGEMAGYRHIRLEPRQKLSASYWDSREGALALEKLEQELAANAYLIIDSNDSDGQQVSTMQLASEQSLDTEDVRRQISQAIGEIFGALLPCPDVKNILITGGDTLLACMKQLNVCELEPVCELFPGTVLSRFRYRDGEKMILTKSGGFGQKTLLQDLKPVLQENSGSCQTQRKELT